MTQSVEGGNGVSPKIVGYLCLTFVSTVIVSAVTVLMALGHDPQELFDFVTGGALQTALTGAVGLYLVVQQNKIKQNVDVVRTQTNGNLTRIMDHADNIASGLVTSNAHLQGLVLPITTEGTTNDAADSPR